MPRVADILDPRGYCEIKKSEASHSISHDETSTAMPNSASAVLEPPKKRQKRQRRRGRACTDGEIYVRSAERASNNGAHCDEELFRLAEALVELASGCSLQTSEAPSGNNPSLLTLEEVFPDQKGLPTEKLAAIQRSLQDYLSDFHILHDPTMQLTLGLVEESTPSLGTGTSKYTGAWIDKKIDGHQRPKIALERFPVFAALHKKLCQSSSPITRLDVFNLRSSVQPQERQKLVECLRESYSTETAHYCDGYMWIDGDFIVKDAKMRASGLSSLHQLLEAVWNSSRHDKATHLLALPLRVAWFPPAKKWTSLATDVLQFLSGSGWDKSSLGHAGSGCELPRLCYTTYTQAKGGQESRICKEWQEALQLLESFVNSTEIPSDVSSAILKNEMVLTSIIGKWKIGRPWASTTTLSVLQEALQGRTVLIDNIPFKCTPAQLGRMVEFETGHQIAHVSIPRFSVSRENKGFGFVEMRSKEDAEHAIKELNGRWPSSWDNTGTSGPETFIRRNKRPLLVLSYSEWQARKKQAKDVSKPPPGSSWATSPGIAKPFFSENPVWARLDGITPPITTLGIWHYVEHSDAPVDFALRNWFSVFVMHHLLPVFPLYKIPQILVPYELKFIWDPLSHTMSVTPLQVVYHPPDRFALVLLKSVEDFKKLEIDGIMGGGALTGWNTSASSQSFIKVTLAAAPSRSATLCDSPDCTLVVGHLPCSK